MGLFDKLFERYKRSRPARKLPPAHQGTGGSNLTSEHTAEALEGHLQVVSSSNVSSYQYNSESQALTVEYHGGGRKTSVYLYFGVSEWEVEDLATAPSKGKWVHQHLIGSKRGQSLKPFRKIR